MNSFYVYFSTKCQKAIQAPYCKLQNTACLDAAKPELWLLWVIQIISFTREESDSSYLIYKGGKLLVILSLVRPGKDKLVVGPTGRAQQERMLETCVK